MRLKLVSGVVLVLLLTSMLTFTFNIQPVRAGETIFIRADGSVDPDTAPIWSVDNITYTFSGDIAYPTYNRVIVERSNITINGNGYTLQGSASLGGFLLSSVNNVTIKNTNITVGSWASYEHPAGVELDNSNCCVFFENNITNLRYGVMAYSKPSINNTFFHNNFVDNHVQVNIDSSFANFWDDGYPSGGNLWSGLTEVDYFSGPNQDQPGSDGIGDLPYLITRLGTSTTITNIDRYPLGGTSECTGTHDAAVMTVTPSKNIVGQGNSISINVTVENQGESTETFGVATPHWESQVIPSSVRWKAFWGMGDVNRDGCINEGDEELIEAAWFSTPGAPNWNPDADIDEDLDVDTQDLVILVFHIYLDIWTYSGLPIPPTGTQRGVRLHSGNQTTLAFMWNTTGFAKGNYTINANATIVPGEIDPSDNNFTDGWVIVAMAGDISGPEGWPDELVDIDDVMPVALAFGAIEGQDSYNPNYDFNNDGLIDIDDVLVPALRFGEIDP